MARIYLAHVTVYDPAISAEKVLRYCTGRGFVTGTDPGMRPPGVDAHAYYAPRIKQPGSMRRDCFGRGTTGGRSETGYGELVLVNSDGVLDGFLDYGLDGRTIEIIVGDIAPASVPTYSMVIKGTMEQSRVSRDSVAIRIRDRQFIFEQAVQAVKYAGDNNLPAGLEGVAGDLKGKPKPRCYGRAFNLSPPCVNTSRLIYQVNHGAVQSVDAVYDRGVALTKGADYSSQSDMETNAPAAGYFRSWPAGGYFRLGSTPAGQITADVAQGAAAANRTAAQILSQIATGPAGLSAGDVSSADITALDAANSAECGIWIDGERDCAAVMDDIANSVGAWWGFDRLGMLRMARLETAAGTPAVEITDAEIIRIDRIETSDSGKGIPSWRTKLRYKRLWTTQDSDLAGAVTDARRAELRTEYRETVAEDASVKNAHLLAPELEFETLLVDATAASTEASRRLALYKTRRDRFEARIALTSGMASTLDIGVVVRAVHPRFGLAAGKLLRVIGLQPDLRSGRIDLTLWG